MSRIRNAKFWLPHFLLSSASFPRPSSDQTLSPATPDFVHSHWRTCPHAAQLDSGGSPVFVPAPDWHGTQDNRKTVTIEVYQPEGAKLFIEGRDSTFKGPMRRFVSPPLPPGKYIYTITAIIPGPNGPKTVTHQLDIRPGDFESIDLREPGQRPIADVEYEPTPQNVVDAALRLAKVTSNDVLWDLGCGDGRIPVTAAKTYACKASGFDIDPERVKDSLANGASKASSAW